MDPETRKAVALHNAGCRNTKSKSIVITEPEAMLIHFALKELADNIEDWAMDHQNSFGKVALVEAAGLDKLAKKFGHPHFKECEAPFQFTPDEPFAGFKYAK